MHMACLLVDGWGLSPLERCILLPLLCPDHFTDHCMLKVQWPACLVVRSYPYSFWLPGCSRVGPSFSLSFSMFQLLHSSLRATFCLQLFISCSQKADRNHVATASKVCFVLGHLLPVWSSSVWGMVRGLAVSYCAVQLISLRGFCTAMFTIYPKRD